MENKEKEKTGKWKIDCMFKSNEKRRLNSNRSQKNIVFNRESKEY